MISLTLSYLVTTCSRFRLPTSVKKVLKLHTPASLGKRRMIFEQDFLRVFAVEQAPTYVPT